MNDYEYYKRDTMKKLIRIIKGTCVGIPCYDCPVYGDYKCMASFTKGMTLTIYTGEDLTEEVRKLAYDKFIELYGSENLMEELL